MARPSNFKSKEELKEMDLDQLKQFLEDLESEEQKVKLQGVEFKHENKILRESIYKEVKVDIPFHLLPMH